MIITIVHEIRWLPNDVETQLTEILSTIRRMEQKMTQLSDSVAAIANDVTELQAASQRVIDLLSQPTPDVVAAIAALQAADAQFDAVTTALNAAGTTPEPPPEG